MPSFEEDICFINEKHCVPGFRKIKPFHKLAFNECFDRADISHCESKEWPVQPFRDSFFVSLASLVWKFAADVPTV